MLRSGKVVQAPPTKREIASQKAMEIAGANHRKTIYGEAPDEEAFKAAMADVTKAAEEEEAEKRARKEAWHAKRAAKKPTEEGRKDPPGA